MPSRLPWTERLRDHVRQGRGIWLTPKDARLLRERLEHDPAAQFLRVLDQVPDDVWYGLDKLAPGLRDTYLRTKALQGIGKLVTNPDDSVLMGSPIHDP
jgi:hypothetical protein